MSTWTLAKKELRILLRDRLAFLVLLALPVVYILLLALLIEDDRLRISLVDEDVGSGLTESESWSKVVQRDLAETAGIKVELLPSREAAKALIANHKRAAVLVFTPTFSDRVNQCSFLVDGVNPFHRDGVYLSRIGAELLKDDKQPGASAIIEQVAQVTLLRVILPYMIGKAFDRLSDPAFIKVLGEEVKLPVPQVPGFELLYGKLILKAANGEKRIRLQSLLELASQNDPKKVQVYQDKVGEGVQNALKEQFKNYNLRGKTWAALTKSLAEPKKLADGDDEDQREGVGVLRLGSRRNQVIIPAATVLFTFFLVLIVGSIFVVERRQGTLKRLWAAPVTRGQVLLGKALPYFLVSLSQGVLLLLAGRFLFRMYWGPSTWSLAVQIGWLLPVVAATSLAATGFALVIAALARSELQVVLFGVLPALGLALLGGCLLPREMMPEGVQRFAQLTPQGWALDAYRELLDVSPTATPNLAIVTQACIVLTVFGLTLITAAWGLLRRE